METFLFLDTETTGFAKGGTLIQYGQARVCQLAMILADEKAKKIAEFSTLIKPTDWEISAGAEKCHGISQQECELHGLDIEDVMDIYHDLSRKAGMNVAHNMSFDKRMMNIESAYHTGNTGERLEQRPVSWFCTQEKSTQVCQIPPTPKMMAAGRHHYKAPTLEEAYKHFTGFGLDGAHDAMVDTRACMTVFFGLRGIRI